MDDPICVKCGKTIVDPGALVFSPPIYNTLVVKTHLCTTCYISVATFLGIKR